MKGYASFRIIYCSQYAMKKSGLGFEVDAGLYLTKHIFAGWSFSEIDNKGEGLSCIDFGWRIGYEF